MEVGSDGGAGAGRAGCVLGLGEGKDPGREVDNLIGGGGGGAKSRACGTLSSFSSLSLATVTRLSVTLALKSGLDFAPRIFKDKDADEEESPSAGASDARRDHAGRIGAAISVGIARGDDVGVVSPDDASSNSLTPFSGERRRQVEGGGGDAGGVGV